MALSLDQLTAISQKKFIPKLVDNIFDSDPLLNRAKKKGWYKTVSGGERLVTPLEYALTTSAGWYAGEDTLNTADNETFTGAEWTWKQAYANIAIKRSDELKNSGDTQVVDLLKAKTKSAEKTLADILGDGIYSDGTTAKAIVGLRSIIGTANTVGGISQTDYSWWRGQVDSSTTTLTIAALQTMYNNLTINNEGPSVLVGGRARYNSFYALLQPQQRFMDSETAKAGFSSLMFNGTPFIVGSKAPTAHLFMLNEEYLVLAAQKEEDFRLEPFVKPANQNVKIGKVYWMGSMGCTNIRMQGKFSALTA